MIRSARTEAERPVRGWKDLDGVTFLTLYLVLLFAIPSRLTIGPLGGAGSPALILGAGSGLLWSFYQVQRDPLPRIGRHPVRIALVLVLLSFTASYVHAMTHPLDATESGTADLGLIILMAWAGLLLFTHDLIPSTRRLLVLVRRLVLGASLVALLGLVQFVTGQELINYISIPGLSLNNALSDITLREGFYRPFGTALHPIEFGAVLTMALPLALALALSESRRGWLRRWAPVAVLGAAVTMSVSRSAFLGAAVGTLVLIVVLPGRVVRRLLVAAVAFTALVFLTVPGMIGSVLGLFTKAGSDPSVASRTDSYALAGGFFERSPLFGRGFGTFLPRYRIFDNQYLLSLIEVGAVGLVALLGLLGAAIVVARRARQLTDDPAIALLAQAMVASIWVAVTGLAIFDGFSFPMGSGMIFLVLGMSGALYRLTRLEQLSEVAAGSRSPAGSGVGTGEATR